MDRRVKAAQSKRKAAARKKAEAQRASATLAYGDAWGTVKYIAGKGYEVGALHDTKALAEDAARLGTQKALDDGNYLTDAPYTVVFAVPVERAPKAPKYERGQEYFAALRAPSGNPERRALYLFISLDEARALEQLEAEPDDAFKCIGGPVSLPVAD